MKKIYILIICIMMSLVPSVVLAQDSIKCEGPADLCAQVLDLKQKLREQKDKVKTEVDSAVQNVQVSTSDKAKKLAAISAILAVALKILLSLLGGWKEYFRTDKGKAWLRLTTLIVGFLAFIASDLGAGLGVWGSLIIACGGPGAILVHEITKIVPALRSKGPLPPSNPPPENQDVPLT